MSSVGADLRRKAFDLQVALVCNRAVDRPHAFGRARVLILRRSLVCRIVERRSRGPTIGRCGELQGGAGGPAIGGDLPCRDDCAVGEAVGIAYAPILDCERRINISNTIDTRGVVQVGDPERDRASGRDTGCGKRRGAARRVVGLVACYGQRTWRSGSVTPVAAVSDGGRDCAAGGRRDAGRFVGPQRPRYPRTPVCRSTIIDAAVKITVVPVRLRPGDIRALGRDAIRRVVPEAP